MNGLNLRQEAALAIARAHQDEGAADFTNLGLSDAFVSLKNLGMIKLTTDVSDDLAFFQGMEAYGLNHYTEARKARRRFEAVSDHADALLLILAVRDAEKRAKQTHILEVPDDLDGIPLYQELSRRDLLNVTWADNSPYFVQVTDKGRKYAEGWFQDQMENSTPNISIAPVFNNNGAATASASASASATIQDITLGQTIEAIVGLNIDEQVKNEAEQSDE